jgi:hypothetical protein
MINSKFIQDDANYDEWIEQDIIKSYQKAAEQDEFLFGDYDYHSEWICTSTNDVF